MYLQDGYKLIRAEHLIAALHALNDRKITFRAFRAFIGSFELAAIRDAAEREGTGRSSGSKRRYLQSELAAMIGERSASVSRELKALKRTALLVFTEAAIVVPEIEPLNVDAVGLLGGRGAKRLVPVPRQVLKYVARSTRPALAKTMVAYLLRGLSLDRNGRMRGVGTVKVSWICRLCRISERAARAARAELIRLGWITKDTGSFQKKLNRDGAYFIINLVWRRVMQKPAPLGVEKRTRFAPPKEIQETPYGSKNQKPAPTEQATGVPVEQDRPPNIRNVQEIDLRKPARLEVLYRQAVAANLIAHSEANIRNFAAAAVRATRAGGRVGPIFLGIIKKQLWSHITQEQEERAAAVLKRFRDQHPGAFEIDQSESTPARGEKLSTGNLIMAALAKSQILRRPTEAGPRELAEAHQKLKQQILKVRVGGHPSSDE